MKVSSGLDAVAGDGAGGSGADGVVIVRAARRAVGAAAFDVLIDCQDVAGGEFVAGFVFGFEGPASFGAFDLAQIGDAAVSRGAQGTRNADGKNQ